MLDPPSYLEWIFRGFGVIFLCIADPPIYNLLSLSFPPPGGLYVLWCAFSSYLGVGICWLLMRVFCLVRWCAYSWVYTWWTSWCAFWPTVFLLRVWFRLVPRNFLLFRNNIDQLLQSRRFTVTKRFCEVNFIFHPCLVQCVFFQLLIILVLVDASFFHLSIVLLKDLFWFPW